MHFQKFKLPGLALVLSLLVGCSTSVIRAVAPDAPGSMGIENHLETDSVPGAAIFKLRSQGKSYGDVVKESQPTEWITVGDLRSRRFHFVFLAKPREVERVKVFLEMPVDDSAWNASATKLDALNILLARTDALMATFFQNKKAGAEVVMYLADFNSPISTPYTDWQFGPTVDPVRLNLAMKLPPLGANFERHQGFDDRRFFSDVLSSFSHEYAHAINRNAPFAMVSPLGDEFIAHTIHRCISLAVYEFTNDRVNAQLIETGQKFRADKTSILKDLPFATSTTGGQLAIISFGVLLSRPEIIAMPKSEWLRYAQDYCKMVIEKAPSFETTSEALDWIEKNVELGSL